jgi:hypothetical protein
MLTRLRPRRLLLLPLLGTVVALAVSLTAPSAAVAATMPTPHEKAAIEGFAPDQAQFFCRNTVEPGVKAFERLVLKTYPVTGTDGDMRGCDVGGSSEHKDGRAWDWGADHRNAKQRKAGHELLHWLFATDAHGNRDAMFRRLGLMYIIWNHKIWGGWSQQWEPYSCSGVTLCHVDHMHFSFGWAGAERKTSYWTHTVGHVVEPPLPALTRKDHTRSLRVTARGGQTTAMWLVKGGDTYRAVATGTWHHAHKSTARADAVCTRTSHGWVPSASVTVGGDQLNSWGEHWVPTHDTGNGCNTTDHRYRLTLTPSSSSTVQVTLPDDSRGNDSGAVVVHVTRTA